MNAKHLPSFVVCVIACACAKSQPPAEAEASCRYTIETGVVGRSTQQSDTDRSISPNRHERLLIFRADEPGLASPMPPELEQVAARLRPDVERTRGGKPNTQRMAPPPERLGAPVAVTDTDAEGCFEAALPPGEFVIGMPESIVYVGLTVRPNARTHCGRSTGYRFAQWSCGAPG